MNIERIKTIFLILTALLALTLTLKAEEKNFKVSKGGKLEIKVNLGDIKLQTWDKDEILVKSDKGLNYEQNGNVLRITSGSYFTGSTIFLNLPGNFNADIKTGAGNLELKGTLAGNLSGQTLGGDVRMENVNGLVDVSTAGGNISFGNIKGNAIFKSGGGDIKTGNIDGEFNLKTGGGNVSLGKIGKTLKLKTGGGNIKIIEIGSNSIVTTSGGNIYIEKSFGNSELTTGGGDIKMSYSKGEVNARTSSGKIVILGAQDKLTLNTGSGDAEIGFVQGYSGSSFIKTSNGNVELMIPESVKATVVAKVNSWNSWDEDENQGSADNIKSDYKPSKVEKIKGRNEAVSTYNINGGGSNVNLETSNGTIIIRKK